MNDQLINKILTPSQYIGTELKTRRKAQGLTGADLAKLAHISQQQISRYECGKNAFHLEMLYTLFFILKMDVYDVERLMRKSYLFSINKKQKTKNKHNNDDDENSYSDVNIQYVNEYEKKLSSRIHKKNIDF